MVLRSRLRFYIMTVPDLLWTRTTPLNRLSCNMVAWMVSGVSSNSESTLAEITHADCTTGARFAEDCLWKAAQAFPETWDWFLSDAETHVRSSLTTIMSPCSQATAATFFQCKAS